jgi:hypothetical protein
VVISGKAVGEVQHRHDAMEACVQWEHISECRVLVWYGIFGTSCDIGWVRTSLA